MRARLTGAAVAVVLVALISPAGASAHAYLVRTVPAASGVPTPWLIARWVLFASVMSAIGLLVLRLLIARTLIRRIPGSTLSALTRATIVAAAVGLIAIPVYLDFAIANDSLRSVFDLGAIVPLFRATAFARGYVDLELCFALFCVAGAIALWLDRPDREKRSIAELGATGGALLAAL